jgi:hypothetical protein
MDTKELYLLHIIPIDDSTATLHSIEGKPISVGVFSTIGTYEGARYYGTPEELQIVSGFYQDKEYTITSIDGMTFSHCRNLKKIFIEPTLINGRKFNRLTLAVTKIQF